MRYRISRAAHSDLDEVWKEIAVSSGSVETAERVDEEIHASIKRLARFPGMGHRRREVPDDRILFWSVYKYLIAYRIDKGVLVVVRVVHGARDMNQLFPQAE